MTGCSSPNSSRYSYQGEKSKKRRTNTRENPPLYNLDKQIFIQEELFIAELTLTCLLNDTLSMVLGK